MYMCVYIYIYIHTISLERIFKWNVLSINLERKRESNSLVFLEKAQEI